MSVNRVQVDKFENDLMHSLMKFEDVAHAYYADQDYSKRVLTHPDNEDLKDKVTNNF